jgi:hypothetical protein
VAVRRGAVLPVVAGVSTLAIAVLWTVGPYLFGDRDHAESIDSRPVHDAALAACKGLRTALESVPPGAGRSEAENRAVEAMVARVRALGPEALRRDVPTESWLADWERLVEARRRAATSGGKLALPEAGGAPITRRMDDLVKGALRPCQVPLQLYRPAGPSGS